MHSISLYKSATSTSPVTVSLSTFLTSEKHAARIAAVRACSDKKERDQLKKQLPGATISGTFLERSAAKIENYNGLVCLDFDGKDNPDLTATDMRTLLASVEQCLYAGLSVGGQGVFAIIPTDCTDPLQHATVVEILGIIMGKLGLVYDKACKDVCRLRFVSHDPEAFINWLAPVFPAQKYLALIQPKADERPPRPVQFIKPRENDNGLNLRVESCITQAEQYNVDVTTNYDDWIRVGMALATQYGLGGEDYFHRLSRMSPKYNPTDTQRKYYNLVRTTSRVKIGTFFNHLEQFGIKP